MKVIYDTGRYCILVTGIPASGKSTLAEKLADELGCPWFSKDKIKEILFDTVGFQSRGEKNKLGLAGMEILYYAAEQCMKQGQLFILENNFETVSREGLLKLLDQYCYTAVTLRLTGDYQALYQRFSERDVSPDRHFGHVTNTCYPPKDGETEDINRLSYEGYVYGIEHRGMDKFRANGPCIEVDTTDFAKVDMEKIVKELREAVGASCRKEKPRRNTD